MSPVPLLLVIGSLAIFILEVLVVSFGILSLIGISLGIGGIVMAFNDSQAYGWSLIGVLVVGAPLSIRAAFKILPRLPFARGFFLDPPAVSKEDRGSAAAAPTELVGTEGEATSPLRPSGNAVFLGEPHDVVTRGEMIPTGARIRVVEVSGNRIIVEEA